MANLNRLPLSAFDPRLKSLIERGCHEYTEVACDTTRKAQHLRNLLTTFRARLKKEKAIKPEEWEPLYGTIISVKKGFPTVVTLRPRLSEFDSILSGLDLQVPPESTLPNDPLEAILAETEKDRNSNGT